MSLCKMRLMSCMPKGESRGGPLLQPKPSWLGTMRWNAGEVDSRRILKVSRNSKADPCEAKGR